MDYIMLPSSLVGFTNDCTKIVKTSARSYGYLVHGAADASLGHVSVIWSR